MITACYEANIRRMGTDAWRMLECIRAHPEGVTLSEAREETGVDKDVAQGIIHTLHINGMIRPLSRSKKCTLWGAKRWRTYGPSGSTRGHGPRSSTTPSR